MKKLAIITASLFFALTSEASILKTEASGKTVESIQIAKNGYVTMKGDTTNVSLVGAGLRRKKVAILKVKIYVAELLASDASKFVRDNEKALESLNQSQTIAIRLNFVYSVDGATVRQAFADALKSNNINTTEAAIAKTLQVIAQAGEFKTGESITFVAQKENSDRETLYFENPRGVVTEINGSKGFSKNFFALWLGKPADEQTAELKNQLVKGL